MPNLFSHRDGTLIVHVPPEGIAPALLAQPLALPFDGVVDTLRVDADRGWRWGTSDAAFFALLLERLGGALPRIEGLPPDLLTLLQLGARERQSQRPPPAPAPWLARLGEDWLARGASARAFLALLGEIVLRLPRLALGRARVRRAEVVDVIAESSTRAMLIVGTVNLLMGAILAFVGVVQLKAFGAGIYVADLVGIASVRELCPIMTAIVLAGRTGASFAARIATMQGNEEIDALIALGVSPVEFLALPRAVALTLLMPLLNVYACAVSLLGGLAVSGAMLDVSAQAYLAETQLAIAPANFAIGATKSLVFGAMVALIGCHCGLRAGRSAAAVGRATTDAVVISIVGIIAVDAVFAVCANALGV